MVSGMLAPVVHVLVRAALGVALGAAPAGLLGAVVGVVHRCVWGRWDRSAAFAVVCVLGGAALGLLGGIASALSAEAVSSSPPATAQAPAPKGRPFRRRRGCSEGAVRAHPARRLAPR
jgi:hypothetical protein